MYHRAHVEKFLQRNGIPSPVATSIRTRTEEVIAATGFEGYFSGSKIDEVLGDQALVTAFKDAWERGGLL